MEPNERTGTDFREYLDVLRLRKRTIAVTVLLVLGAVLAYSFRQVPIYEAEAKVLVKALPSRSGGFTALLNLDTERELVESQTVDELATEALAEDGVGEAREGGLSVTVAIETEVLNIRFSDPDPVMAQQAAQAYAEAYLAFRRQEVVNDLLATSETIQQQVQNLDKQLEALNARIEKTDSEAVSATLQVQANSMVGQIAILQQQMNELTPPERLRVGQVVEDANLPAAPASPKHVNNALLGLVAGLALGIPFAFLREKLDDRLRGKADLEAHLGVPVLAVVPRVTTWRRRKEAHLVTREEPRSSASEAYRTLRTGLLFAAAQRGTKVILITSANAGEGKSTTTANLGIALAQSGKRVILVSGDLRKPRLATFFGFKRGVGITDVLAGEADVWETLFDPGVRNIRVMPAGPVPGNPAELLGSENTKIVLNKLASAADFVLIDGAPVLALADAMILAPFTDGVLFVVDAERTKRGHINHARQQLEHVNAHLIGCVMNNFDPSGQTGYYYYSRDYYGDHVASDRAVAGHASKEELAMAAVSAPSSLDERRRSRPAWLKRG